MKKRSKIIINAVKILDYLIDNNAMAGRGVKLQDIFNALNLSEKEFDVADTYLLQQKYVDGTMGGMGVSRYLTGSGVEFHEENSSLLEHSINEQEVIQMPHTKKVFVVHGRDNRLRDDFFSFLRALDLQPIEWSEALKLTGKATPYIGEALESAFKNARAVIVLLSPDDEVRLSPGLWKTNEDENEKDIRLQARPNVLFEAGMAFGTHPDRTIFVEVGQVKSFSDIAGRHVVRLSNSAQKRNEIAERLRTAGCDVSTSGNDWLNTGDFEVVREQESAFNSKDHIPDGDEEISHGMLILSRLMHPGLPTLDHNNCVITGRLFNKSMQKVVINRIRAYDRKGNLLNITWSNRINPYGNPENPYELIGFVDSEDIFVRQDNGEEIEYCKLEIFHSLSQEPLTGVFDKYADWIDQQ
jgi:predicted nucleotide-binding protein